MKIAIIGYSGSGKSTLANQIGILYNCPILYLDKIQFEANWKERDEKTAIAMVKRFLDDNNSWVIDGYYDKFLRERRLEEADIIAFMCFSRFKCLYQAFKRYIKYYGKTRESMAPNCNEKLDFEFIKWILLGGRSKEKKLQYNETIQKYKQKIVILKNKKQVVLFLEELKNEVKNILYEGEISMRRKDREMSREFGIEVIDRASYGVVSMIDENNEPYGIPLSIVRDGNNLYFHSALDGKKVKVFEKNPIVSVSFVGQINIPENFTKEELIEIKQDKSKSGELISKVFTTEYESAIVRGKVMLLEDNDEKLKAIRHICEKYTPTKMEYFNLAVESGLKMMNIFKIEIHDITAKRKKYDTNGEEMKWGRME